MDGKAAAQTYTELSSLQQRTNKVEKKKGNEGKDWSEGSEGKDLNRHIYQMDSLHVLSLCKYLSTSNAMGFPIHIRHVNRVTISILICQHHLEDFRK